MKAKVPAEILNDSRSLGPFFVEDFIIAQNPQSKTKIFMFEWETCQVSSILFTMIHHLGKKKNLFFPVVRLETISESNWAPGSFYENC